MSMYDTVNVTLQDTRIMVEKSDVRRKITLPLDRNWLAIIAYTALVLVWLVMAVIFLTSLFRPPALFNAESISSGYRIGWRALIIVWLLFWGRYVGRYLLRWWQHYLAGREILFFEHDDKIFILRRPVSVFGITNAFDMRHMRPFYFSEQHNAVAFQYGGVQHYLLGMGLTNSEAEKLINFVNERYFPNYEDEDDEDDV